MERIKYEEAMPERELVSGSGYTKRTDDDVRSMTQNSLKENERDELIDFTGSKYMNVVFELFTRADMRSIAKLHAPIVHVIEQAAL